MRRKSIYIYLVQMEDEVEFANVFEALVKGFDKDLNEIEDTFFEDEVSE